MGRDSGLKFSLRPCLAILVEQQMDGHGEVVAVLVSEAGQSVGDVPCPRSENTMATRECVPSCNHIFMTNLLARADPFAAVQLSIYRPASEVAATEVVAHLARPIAPIDININLSPVLDGV